MELRLAYLVMHEPEVFLVHELLGLAQADFSLSIYSLRGLILNPSNSTKKLAQAGMPLWCSRYFSWESARDMGYWSGYSLTGQIASSYYQAAHICQLQVLSATFPVHAATFDTMCRRFEEQNTSPLKRARAISTKIVQKIIDPPGLIFR